MNFVFSPQYINSSFVAVVVIVAVLAIISLKAVSYKCFRFLVWFDWKYCYLSFAINGYTNVFVRVCVVFDVSFLLVGWLSGFLSSYVL